MKKQQFLLLISLFISSILFAQSNNQKEVLDSLQDGDYKIEVFYFDKKKVGYEITKNKVVVSKEIIEPQLGSTLGSLKTKEQFKEELMKMAKFVLKHLKSK